MPHNLAFILTITYRNMYMNLIHTTYQYHLHNTHTYFIETFTLNNLLAAYIYTDIQQCNTKGQTMHQVHLYC